MFLFATDLKDTWLPILICYDRIYSQIEYEYFVFGWNFQQKLINEINTSNLYRGYFCYLGSVVKLSSLTFHFRVKSDLPILDDVKLTFIIYFMAIIFYQYHIKKVNKMHKIKSRLLKNVVICKRSKVFVLTRINMLIYNEISNIIWLCWYLTQFPAEADKGNQHK